MTFPKLLMVLRHGQTAWNAEERFQGRLDIPLNERGRSQAKGHGEALKKLLQNKAIDPRRVCVHASPLGRAQETARIACETAGIPIKIQNDGRLAEQYYGEWEGKLFQEIRTAYPDVWAMRLNDPLSYTPKGGEPGSSVKKRMTEALLESEEIGLFVSHFGLVRVLVQLCRDYGFKMPENIREIMGRQNLLYYLEEGELHVIESSASS